MEDKITVQKEDILKAYNQASEEQKALLENIFGKEIFVPKDIKERVKTFEDACEVLGEEHSYVQEYRGVANINFDFTQDIIAYLKLRIICAALNEGWKPIFDEGECRYYPWFSICSKKEYEKLVGEEKQKCRVVGLSSYSYSLASGGLAFAYANYASSFSVSGYCSRLAFKTRELAEYCGKQFIDIWADFLFA